MDGTAAGNGWVGGTVDGNELVCNGRDGGINPMDDGGNATAGPGIPDGIPDG